MRFRIEEVSIFVFNFYPTEIAKNNGEYDRVGNALMKRLIQAVRIAGLFWCLTLGTAAYCSDFSRALSDGHHVLLIRHADAPGFGDPPGYTLENCSSQRNLGKRGRQQAAQIGHWLRQQGIQKARVYSSPWCRCRDTGQLLAMGDVVLEGSLGSFFDDMSRGPAQTRQLQQFIAQRLREQPAVPLILVTHHVNIEAYTGKVVAVGDMVLVKVGQHGESTSFRLYPSPGQ